MWSWEGMELPADVVAELESLGSISHAEANRQYERIAREMTSEPWYRVVLRALFPSLFPGSL